MNILIFIAGLLFAACAIVLTIVLAYQPKPSAPVFKQDEIRENEEKLSYANKWKRWTGSFEKTHADIQILFEKTPLQHGVFLEGRLAKESGHTLFIFHQQETLELYLQALEELMGNHELSILSDDILLTDTADGKAEGELVDILRKKGKRYAMCLSDTSGIIERNNILFGCMGILRKSVIYLSSDEEKEGTWYGKETWGPSVLKKMLPFRLQLQLLLPKCKKGIGNLVLLFPEGKVFFTSFVHVEKGQVIISAKDEETSEKLLGWYRKQCSSSLVLKKQIPSSQIAGKEVTEKVQAAIASSFENVVPLPVMQEDEISCCLDPFVHSRIAFAPVGRKDISHRAAVAFYRNLRLQEGRTA